MTGRKTLAVIVPCHNESANIEPFYQSAKNTLDALPVDWALIFVNDASTDDTLERILALRAGDGRVRVATLSRNFGYHSALVAGLSSADVDLYAIVDVDGEDPPEMLAKFHTAVQKGAHTVYGIRSQRPEPRHIVFCRWLFYWINLKIADGPIKLWMAEYSMFTRVVRDHILANKTTFPFLRAELAYVGLRMEGVPYVRQPRLRGTSHYNFWRMAQFAIGGFLASSTFPLRASLYLSAAFAAFFLLLVPALGLGLVEAGALAGVLGFLFLLLTVPMLALYIARTYKNVTARPVFFLDPDKSRL
ncbi:MAG: glycosyltransferase family 2 protein [Elusimicrobia bacterium]|nr:glycosyltransferase family 2 protein [Elusimicrobiota bacterium]